MYRGRFAPSPTGPLHFGSLIAAVASYLQAQRQHGEWLVRMEDLDSPRIVAGAADDILHTLETFGFKWNGGVMYQSQRNEAYAAALNTLQKNQLIYRCSCSRREIADSAALGIDGPVYPGTCRNGPLPGKSQYSLRIRTADEPIGFEDEIQGMISQNLARDIGDFVLRRADGIYTYQLAVVVDDAEQGITHILRGADLLDSTPRQIYLQQLLGMPTPRYGHIPVAANAQGEKLSKQTLAHPLDIKNPASGLWLALDFLEQAPPAELKRTSLDVLWDWAKIHWQLSKVPRQRLIRGSE